ncbi:hypothetical protein EHYA_08631 [Embleya hyalina]|uniref:Uncharacterized protein n=1 Tax=Embleya hyalina TaxID=516124 RepID=A0A401Z262_9ACTN|nr:hypothetical protein EHYA_08631 [Embleya hyalina]
MAPEVRGMGVGRVGVGVRATVRGVPVYMLPIARWSAGVKSAGSGPRRAPGRAGGQVFGEGVGAPGWIGPGQGGPGGVWRAGCAAASRAPGPGAGRVRRRVGPTTRPGRVPSPTQPRRSRVGVTRRRPRRPAAAPQDEQAVRMLAEAHHAGLARHPEGVERGRIRTRAEAEFEPAAAEGVPDGGVLGEPERVLHGGNHDMVATTTAVPRDPGGAARPGTGRSRTPRPSAPVRRSSAGRSGRRRSRPQR